VGIFSLFGGIATYFRKYGWSRLLMWAGILSILGGCYLFGINVHLAMKLEFWVGVAAIFFFAVIFGLSAAYFVRQGRKKVEE
jgi:hypothetical protein